MKKVIAYIRRYYPRDYFLDFYDVNDKQRTLNVLPALYHSLPKVMAYAKRFCKNNSLDIVEYVVTPMMKNKKK